MRQRGFTLIEVLIAFAIFALSAVVLGSAYLNVLNAYELAHRGSEQSDDVAFSRMQLLTEPDRTKATDGASYDADGGRHIQWRSTIDNTNTADVFHVNFTCEISAPNQDTQTVTESFMLFRPTWSDPADNSKLRQTAADRINEMHGKR